MNALRLLLLAACLPAAALSDTLALHDPTRPFGVGGTAGADLVEVWRLSATRITPTQRSAVVNARRVREGDEVDGARVLRIRHAQVDIATPTGPATLRLLPTEAKNNR